MQPRPVTGTGSQTVDTTDSRRPHVLRHCAIDFAGITGCATDRTIRVDNNIPCCPGDLIVEGARTGTGPMASISAGPNRPRASPRRSLPASSGWPRAGYAGRPWGRNEAARINGIQVPGPASIGSGLAGRRGRQFGRTHAAKQPCDSTMCRPPATSLIRRKKIPADPGPGRRPALGRGRRQHRLAARDLAVKWQGSRATTSTDGEPALNARFPSDLPHEEAGY